MRRTTRRIAVAGAISLVAGFFTAVPGASANESTVQGYLALQTGNENFVTLLDANGTPVNPEVKQTLTEGKGCELESDSVPPGTGAELLRFSSADPASPGPGLKDGSIGVRESDTATGTSCAAVDAPGESLVLTIGEDAAKDGLSLIATSVSLDIARKQDAVVTATTMLGGQTTGTYTLPECGDGADCGPDSGVNDHVRWTISDSSDNVVFDTLTLTATAGSFSLSGGADGVVSSSEITGYEGASVFELVDALGCGDTATFEASSEVPSSSWKRLDNLSTDCAAYLYTTESGNESGPYAHFGITSDFDSDAQAVWKVEFVYSGKTPTPLFAFDETPGELAPIEYFEPLGECNPDDVTIDGPQDGWSPTADADYGFGNLDVEGGNVVGFACLLDTDTSNVKGTKTVTFTAYVYGDAGMRF